MNKLLVNAPTGEQQIIHVGPGGGYFDASRVLWDERADGTLPEITLGGMKREGNALVFDAARKTEHDAATAPKVPQSVTHRQAMAELIDRGLVATVQAVLDAIPAKAGELARNDFLRSQQWQRDWPLIKQLQPILGWSDAFVDELFIGAAAR